MSTARRNTLLCRTLCQMPYHVGFCFKGHRCSTMTSCTTKLSISGAHEYDREFAWVQCAKAQWGSGSAFWGSVHRSTRSKCHQLSPQELKKTQDRLSEFMPQPPQVWPDLRYDQISETERDLPLKLVALAPFFSCHLAISGCEASWVLPCLGTCHGLKFG